MPPKSGLASSLQMECGLATGHILKSNFNTIGKQKLKQTDSEITTNIHIRTRDPSSESVQLASDTQMGAHCCLDPAGIGQGMQAIQNNANKDKEIGREKSQEMTNIQGNQNHTKRS